MNINIYIPKIGFKSGELFHVFRNLKLRLTKGAGCCDVYCLDRYLAKKIIKPLRVFRNSTCAYPMTFDKFDDWIKVLDEIIWSFDFLLNDNELPKDVKFGSKKANKYFKRQQKGFELFGKYFLSLWI